MSDLILKASNIAVVRGERELLSGFNYEFYSGKSYSITGKTGCGKTSLLNVLGLLEKPERGEVSLLHNKELTPAWKSSSKFRNFAIRERFSYIFQENELIEQWDGLQNVMLSLLHAPLSANERKEKAFTLLERLHLDPSAIEGRPVSTFSGGERQRVAIARALVTQPTVLFADEPFGSLDRKTAEDLWSLVQSSIKKLNVALIMVTHDEKHAGETDENIKL